MIQELQGFGHWAAMALSCATRHAAELRPPELTVKMMKMLLDFLKRQSRFASLIGDKPYTGIESALRTEYGIGFVSSDRFMARWEFCRISAEELLLSVRQLKSGEADDGARRHAFVVAYSLMEGNTEVWHLRKAAGCGTHELEFNTAQAILLQLATLLGGSCWKPGCHRLDENRVICVVPWGQRTLAVPVYFGQVQDVVCDSEYVIYPRPDTKHYRSTVEVTVIADQRTGRQFVCDGAHITIHCVHPHIDMATHPHGASTHVAQAFLGHFIPTPTCEEIQRYLAAAHRRQPVMFMRKNLGLTHPDLPFHSSGNVVFLDEEADVAQVLRIAEELPCGLSRGFLDYQTGVVPFTFPPALDDWDLRMQQNMMHSGAPFSDQEEAAAYFCARLEDAGVDVSSLDADMIHDLSVDSEDDVLAKAKRLARDALLCLQQHQVAVGWVSEILHEIVGLAAYQGRIKREQEQVSRRWDAPKSAPTQKNRFAAKRERQKRGQETPSVESRDAPQPPTAVQRVRSILSDFHNKVFKYQHYRKAFHALQSTGLLEHFNSEMVCGSHHVLHGKDATSVTVVMPHGGCSEHRRHRFTRSLMSIAGSQVRRRDAACEGA